jgi:hypothetical protein
VTREEAINAITQFIENYACGSDLIGLNTAIETLKKERPHGVWEHWGSPFTDDTIANSIVCTRCKARYVEIDGEVFNFCPNCGADMRGGDEK